jgi:hypothetical protein
MVIELSMPHAATSATSMHLEKRSHQCYSITDNVNGLHTRFVRHTCVVGERRHCGSITGRNDASCFIMMENMSPQNCSQGGPSSEAHDLTIRATIIGVSVGVTFQNAAAA